MQKIVRVMILDDHLIIHHGMVSILEKINYISVVGMYSRSRELMDALRANPPDVVILDFELHPDDADGATLIKSIKIRHPDVKILVVTAHAAASIAMLAFRVGADGFCSKREDLSQIAVAIKTIMVGRKYIPKDLEGNYISYLSNTANLENETSDLNKTISALSVLTTREREIINYILMGMSISDISSKLARSVKTISGHKILAYRKLGIACDAELFKMKDLLK